MAHSMLETRLDFNGWLQSSVSRPNIRTYTMKAQRSTTHHIKARHDLDPNLFEPHQFEFDAHPETPTRFEFSPALGFLASIYALDPRLVDSTTFANQTQDVRHRS